jgi:hypothetical protein
VGRRRPVRALGWILLGLLAGAAAGFAFGLMRGPRHEDVAGTVARSDDPDAAWGAA